MVKQYPHTMRVVLQEDSTQDADTGNWEDGDTETDDITCRAEPSSGNGMVSGADGVKVSYDWIVYMPLPQEEIEPGTQVEIFDASGASLGKGNVKRFSAGQLNARCWI
jgi:hypothetical protein